MVTGRKFIPESAMATVAALVSTDVFSSSHINYNDN